MEEIKVEEIKVPRIESVEVTESYGKIVIEPLERGFGTTLGNALRRMLISSLPGAAVTSLKIEGTFHEFTTIPHVKEDVIDFLLNIKQIRLKPLTYRPGKLFLEKEGEGEVKAGDIKPSSDFEVVNPDLHLATLDSAEARLTVEFNVEMGRGYRPADEVESQTLGLLPVDAIFTPVLKANYIVEPTRVGQATDYDRLILEVWTDGTTTALEAISQAARILVSQFSLFTELGKKEEKEGVIDARLSYLSPERYNIAVDTLGLSTRTLNCLRRSNLLRVGDVLQKSWEELLKIQNFGKKSLDELVEKLKEHELLPPGEAWPLEIPVAAEKG